MERLVGLTELRKRLTDIVGAVCYAGDWVVVTVRGRPVVAIVPISAVKDALAQDKTEGLADKERERGAE